MKLTRRPVLAGAVAFGAGAAHAQSAPFDGEWWGAIDIGPAVRLRLRLVVTGQAASLFSVDQNNAELRADAFTIEGDRLSFRLDAVGASFRGQLREGRIVGEFTQGTTLSLTFGREPIRTPSPVRAVGTPNPAFDGEWFGLLQMGASRLRLRLVVSGEALTLYSLDQGNAALAADTVEIDGANILFGIDRINAIFHGTLGDERIAGTFTQGATAPLVFQRDPLAAPGPPEPLTQERLAALLAQSGAPALAAAAALRGRNRRLALVAGVRQLGAPTPAARSDRWHLGSITKSMTATLVARAVEAGALSWNDTLFSVLGASVPDMRAEYRDVTLRHLLSHRAGLQANIAVGDLLAYPRQNPDARADRITYARQALAQSPAGPKGEHFLYSNSGYVIAGAMLEAKLVAAWESLIRTRLFEPLGMRSAGFGAPGTGFLDEPVGHAQPPGGQFEAFGPGAPINDNPAVLGPAGRVHANLDDVLVYLAAHRDRTRLLRRETWDLLHTPPFGGEYAMGWVVRRDGLWHNGSNTLWYAEVLFDRARGIVAAAASNDGRMQTSAPAVAAALAGAANAVG